MAAWTQARPQEAAAFIATVPMQRVGRCEDDIGRFVATLCSDDCGYINGQSIAVDGGQAYLG
jgi:NAD(P)-dependent dehydrogenase (short-subunit alcohol dehydrogenase family)